MRDQLNKIEERSTSLTIKKALVQLGMTEVSPVSGSANFFIFLMFTNMSFTRKKMEMAADCKKMAEVKPGIHEMLFHCCSSASV